MATERQNQKEGGLEVEEQAKVPSLYQVFLLNDDFTPMDFVVWILEKVFSKPRQEAERLMWDVHAKGQGLCGVYPYDIARTKVAQVLELARTHEHPLQGVMEKVE